MVADAGVGLGRFRQGAARLASLLGALHPHTWEAEPVVEAGQTHYIVHGPARSSVV